MIEVESLSRYYGTHPAVDDVSFRIEANTVVGFLGLNGAGKSTTLKVLAGLIPPSAGTVRIDGADLTETEVNFRRTIGYLPEDPPLHTDMTVEEFLRFVAGLRGMSSREITARLPEVLGHCKLQGYEDRVIGELSHGYRKRVGIAQAIIHGPKLIILDEPISGLDPVQIVGMRDVIRGLATNATVLVSSHNLPEISQTCDQILVLKDGRLVSSGTEHDLARARANTIALTVRGNLDALEAFLKARPDVARYEIVPGSEIKAMPNNARATDEIHVKVDMTEDRREAIVAGLIGAGLGIRRLDSAAGELEEIFLELTREGTA